jgi:hypothetical protein
MLCRNKFAAQAEVLACQRQGVSKAISSHRSLLIHPSPYILHHSPGGSEIATHILNHVQTGHLANVKDAFDRLGYDLADSADDDWSVMWAFHSPFHQRKGEPDVPAIVERMKSHQQVFSSDLPRTAILSNSPLIYIIKKTLAHGMVRLPKSRGAAVIAVGKLQVNQLPGAAHFASKSNLAQASSAIPFLPKSFRLPEQMEEYRNFTQENPDTNWLIKGGMHRGVKHISTLEQALEHISNENDSETFMQQLVRPYLIDRYAHICQGPEQAPHMQFKGSSVTCQCHPIEARTAVRLGILDLDRSGCLCWPASQQQTSYISHHTSRFTSHHI